MPLCLKRGVYKINKTEDHHFHPTPHNFNCLCILFKLLKLAQGSANTCKMAHNSQQLNQLNQGEDLYGYTGPQAWGQAVTAWTSESQSYNFKNPGFSMSTGHFTQVCHSIVASFKFSSEMPC